MLAFYEHEISTCAVRAAMYSVRQTQHNTTAVANVDQHNLNTYRIDFCWHIESLT